MQSLDLRDLKRMEDDWKHILDELPDARKQLHEQLGMLAKGEVDAQIGASGNPSAMRNTARVRRWQVTHIGTRGGYAAIRPAGSREGAASGPNGPGAITNYLENGHKIRPAKKKQRKRLKVLYVNGFHFYAGAAAALEATTLHLCTGFIDELAKKLGGD